MHQLQQNRLSALQLDLSLRQLQKLAVLHAHLSTAFPPSELPALFEAPVKIHPNRPVIQDGATYVLHAIFSILARVIAARRKHIARADLKPDFVEMAIKNHV
jgi:hypothetical protein